MAAPVIAVVADEPGGLLPMDNLLHAASSAPLWCMHSADALPIIRRLQPDLVILALRLAPPATGTQVAARLARDPQTSRIPTIICAADLGSLLVQAQVLQHTGFILLPHPCDPQALLATIHATFANARTRPSTHRRQPPG